MTVLAAEWHCGVVFVAELLDVREELGGFCADVERNHVAALVLGHVQDMTSIHVVKRSASSLSFGGQFRLKRLKSVLTQHGVGSSMQIHDANLRKSEGAVTQT